MDANKPNIEQIQKYLNGELDARAMFELERQAHNDPFLADVIKGMEGSREQSIQPNFADIDSLIVQRVNSGRDRKIVPLWKSLSVAASMLIALGIGGWWLLHQSPKQNVALNAPKPKQQDKAAIDGPLVIKPVKPGLQSNNTAKVNQKEIKGNILTEKTVSVKEQADTIPTLASLVATEAVDTSKAATLGRQYGYMSKPAMPGANAKIRIRGAGTVGTGVPEYVIDGRVVKNFNLSSINSKDILRVDILKSDSATAIYGLKAPSGVIVITTKNSNVAFNKLGMAKPEATFKKEAEPAMAVIKVDSQYLKKYKSAPTISQALSGRVAGVAVTGDNDWNTMRMITGVVIDKNDNSPLPGASVKIRGTETVTQTDANGKFAIKAPLKSETLDVAYIGYNAMNLRVTNTDSVKVALEANKNSLSEVVVIGYGTKTPLLKSAHPVIGWDAYNQYMASNATIADSKTGTVKLTFNIDSAGNVTNIKIVKGLTDEINQKALMLLKNGAKWVVDVHNPAKKVELKITFHKQ